MSITIELPDALEKLLQDEATLTGKTLGQIAGERLSALCGAEAIEEETLAGLRRGLADIAAGRTLSFEEAYTQGRAELIARMGSKHA